MTTKKITTMAFFSTLSIILTRFFSFMIPLGGLPTLSIGFGGVPIMLSGILFGPISGGIVGLVSDLIGFLINDRGGIYHVGFTINSVLTGIVPGLIFLFIKKYKVKNEHINFINHFIIVASTLLGIFYIFSQKEVVTKEYVAWILVGALILISISLIIIMAYLKRKEEIKAQINYFLLSVLLVELLIYVGLTPIWIKNLYGLPSLISIISRILRMVLIVPIKTFLIIVVFKAIPKGKEIL